MSIESLAGSFFVLHHAITHNQIKGIDQKIQKVISEFRLLKPEDHDLEELCRKVIIPYLDRKQLMDLECQMSVIIRGNFPDSDFYYRMGRYKRFTEACADHFVLSGNLEPIEKIWKEGPPLDLNSITLPLHGKNVSLLTYVLKKAINPPLVYFLPKNGLKVNPNNKEEAAEIIKYFTRYSYDELLQLILHAGFDIHCTVESTNSEMPPSLLIGSFKTPADPMRIPHATQSLIFHGAGEEGDFRTLDMKYRYDSWFKLGWTKAFLLRDEVFEKLQKEKQITSENCKDLTLAERELLAKTCFETKARRDAIHQEYAFKPGIQHTCPEHCKIKEICALQSKFLSACAEGDFKSAEQLFSQGVDLNAFSISHPFEKHTSFPLLNYACMVGNVDLVDFLLAHVASYKFGGGLSNWLPPIFECISSNTPNRDTIINLLIKAGAKVDDKQAGTYWAARNLFRNRFYFNTDKASKEGDWVLKAADKASILEDFIKYGIDIDLPNDFPRTMLENVLVDIQIHRDQYRRESKSEPELLEAGTLLIYYGAKINEMYALKYFKEKEWAKPLRDAKEVYHKALNQVLSDHIKDMGGLKAMSLDLIRLIGGYEPFADDIDLPPELRIQVGRRCLELAKQQPKTS
jgi:hypothetical protein